MGAVKLAGMLAALAWAATGQAQSVERWRAHIDEAAARYGVPAAWIERVMRAESGGRTTLNGRPITSRAGAMGLMQLMPRTWAELRAQLGLGLDPHDPRDNILAGAFYLRLMHERFGYPGLFGAYNAGPARYARHLATGRALPAETRTYMASVTGLGPPQAVPGITGGAPPIFVAIDAAPAPPRPQQPARPGASLFFALRGAGEWSRGWMRRSKVWPVPSEAMPLASILHICVGAVWPLAMAGLAAGRLALATASPSSAPLRPCGCKPASGRPVDRHRGRNGRLEQTGD